MSNWSPYAPDFDPSHGIPEGYQGALNPSDPSMNPPSSDPYPSIKASPYPSTEPQYPSTNSPYPSTDSPYSFTNSPYPLSNSEMPPPAFSSQYTSPSSNALADSSPYPPSNCSPYSSSGSTYISADSIAYPTKSSSPYGMHSPSSDKIQNGCTLLRHLLVLLIILYCSGISEGQYITGEGTIKPYSSFDANADAKILKKAMKGFGTDEKAIINILTHRSSSQRVEISLAYEKNYGKDLIEELRKELSGKFRKVVLGLMVPVNDYLAKELHDAMSGIGTKEDVLVEILCTRTNPEIWKINESYNRLYGKSLKEDIKDDTSGNFERLLVSACTGARSTAPADDYKAKKAAKDLYEAGVGQWGTNESVFNSILMSESFQQLAHIFDEYQKLSGHTVTKAIEKEMSGDVKAGMLAIAKSIENRPFYFAERLHKAMRGPFTDDNTLIRIIVSRCEIDMVQIKSEYYKNYGKPLADAIKGDTSGDYKRILVALVHGN